MGGVDSRQLPADSELREKTVRLFTYLHDLTSLRTRNVRNLNTYDEVLWLEAIPRERECFCLAWGVPEGEEAGETWVEIKKPRLKHPPNPPSILDQWLVKEQVADSSREVPELRSEIVHLEIDETGEGKVPVTKTLEEVPEVKRAWERYVEEKWWPWAEQDRPLQAIQRIYTDLFSIYQKQQKLGEAYEAVLGLGLLTWKTANGHEIRRHVITAQTVLTFDAVRGVISVRAAPEGAKLCLELDMLDPDDQPEPAELGMIQEQIAEIEDWLWDGVRIHSILKACAHGLSPRGEYRQTLVPHEEPGSDPVIGFAPAIILRRRTERNLLRVFKDIISQIENGEDIPLGVRRLVSIVDDGGVLPSDEAQSVPPSEPLSMPEETYFPLPVNDEQMEIVRRLSSRQGILVQGPPGTGKSHTIANLIAHLLATGKRVLVTSHTGRALRVLQEKVPDQIGDLCVLLLGDDLQSMQSLEDSVRGITERYNSWNPKAGVDRIALLEDGLDKIRRQGATTLAKLREIREAETFIHPVRFGQYAGTLKSIAVQLKKESASYEWLVDNPKESEVPPLGNAEAAELLALFRSTGPELEEECQKATIELESVPSPHTIIEWVEREEHAQAACAPYEVNSTDERFIALTAAMREQRDSLHQKLNALLDTYDLVTRHRESWVKTAALDILAEKDRSWRDLFKRTEELLAHIDERAKRAEARSVTGLEGQDRTVVRADAQRLLQHLKSGGKLGFGPFRPRVVKETLYLVRQVRVDGYVCDQQQPMTALLEWLEVHNRLDLLRSRWAEVTSPPSGSLTKQVHDYRDLCEPLETALDLHRQLGPLREAVKQIDGLIEPAWHDIKALRELILLLDGVQFKEDLLKARKPLTDLQIELQKAVRKPSLHPAVVNMLDAVRCRSTQGYRDSHETLQRLQDTREKLGRRKELLGIVERSAPRFATSLKNSFPDDAWDDRVAQLEQAWNWARACGWLRSLIDPNAQAQLSSELDGVRERLRRIMGDLAATKAWGYCFANMGEHERQHLVAWTKAMRKIGKGTGKYASHHRKAARENLEECRSAIPAWIMPIYRVAESVTPRPDAFDVVIVDEASQSGPEALFLLYIASQVIVVGDDKQIKPDFTGISRQAAETLRQRHIPDLPLSKHFDLENSLFDHAEIRFGARIRLREHFRCMPEIIQFSNNLCYGSEPLEPLRQYGAARLEPVVTTHVVEGYQKGHSQRIINPPEAEAVAQQIKACIQEPAYKGKSMGVISLLGNNQAKYIERLLLESIGPEALEKRNLVCGDAYAFQGDERDVMFLSLVSAPTEGYRIGTLADQKAERRFNVAASRAKDQLWLFHTATLNDLNPLCLRYRLLEYCLNPHLRPVELEGVNIGELRKLARTVQRTRFNHPPPFDSWFEVDVFFEIIDRGYRVIPQYQLGGYYIDLLVQGIEGRLGVECDGDAWHGPEQYEADVARERKLRRCGLRFWRIRESSFYWDRDAALKDLWETLDSLKIYPTTRSGGASRTGDEDSDSAGSARVATESPTPTVTAPADGDGAEARRPKVQGRQTSLSGFLQEQSRIAFSAADKQPSKRQDEGSTAAENGSLTSPDSSHGETGDAAGSDLLGDIHPYQHWVKRPLRDPRIATIDETLEALLEIIRAEGPMPCHRAYRLFADAAGMKRVGRQIRRFLNRAIAKGVRKGQIEQRNEYGSSDQMNKIVFAAGEEAIVLRTLGRRQLGEVPPSEIGELIRKKLDASDSLSDEDLFRLVLEFYGAKNMTVQILKRLKWIKQTFLGAA